mgnify:CR=1 FL=1
MTDDGELFLEFRRTGRRSVRNRIVEEYMGLAIHIARRYNAGVGRDDDLEQVAMLALVKAVDRFDLDVGVPFSAFAGRTIEGELKRHFRDATWAVKVPRGAKELHVAVRRANDQLSVELGRSPSVDEVAAYLEIDRDDVITGLAAGTARRVGSIDPGPDDDGGSDRNAAMAVGEKGFSDAENEVVVERLLQVLPEREQEIVRPETATRTAWEAADGPDGASVLRLRWLGCVLGEQVDQLARQVLHCGQRAQRGRPTQGRLGRVGAEEGRRRRDQASVHDGVDCAAAQVPSCKRRVAALGAEPLRIHGPRRRRVASASAPRR